jgi:hypothetical protein
MTPDVERVIADLQRALGLPANVGQITINLDDRGLVQSVESRVIVRRVKKTLDTSVRRSS